MTTPEWVSIIALTISSGGFALQARSWLMSGPRLRLSVVSDAVSVPGDDKKGSVALTVINRGTEPAVLTLVVAFIFSSRWRRLRRHPDKACLFTAAEVPAKLEINGTWTGAMAYDEDVLRARAAGHLYVSVVATHSNRDLLINVPPSRVPASTQQQASEFA
jgi:hypothetical protein